MSLLERLKKATPMIAVGATLLSHTAQANESHTEDKAPAPITQRVQSDWQWKSATDKATYDSLPKEYKSFANKSFDERMMMQEEWEQKDYLARQKKHDQMLKRNPNATVGDLYPDSVVASKPLSDFKVGSFGYDDKILKDQQAGKLTPEQAQMAGEMADYGRPLCTLDTKLPYAEQLASCGLDVMARVAAGERESKLSARDHAIFVTQMQTSEKLQFLPENENNRIDLKRRLTQEDNEEYAASHGLLDRLFATKTRYVPEGEYTPTPTKNVNGKTLLDRKMDDLNYSYLDEITLRTAEKIDREEKATQKALAEKVATR